MAGIDTHLRIIKEGVFGRDVRDAIHDGIQKVYEDAIYNGDTNYEVAKARGEFSALPERLSATDELLKNKANEAEIMSMIENILDGSPKGTYNNLASLRQAHPNGTQGIFITTDNNNWNYWNGSSWVSGGVYQSSKISPYDTFAFVAGDAPINFNLISKNIEVVGTNVVNLSGQVKVIKKGNISFPQSTTWIILNTTSMSIGYADNPSASDVIIGAIFSPQSSKPVISFNGIHTINGANNITVENIKPWSQNILFTNNANIVYDRNKSVLKIPQTNVIIGSKELWINAHDLTLPKSAGFIVFDTVTNQFKLGYADQNPRTPVIGFYHYERGQVYLNSMTVNTRIKKIACLGDSITEGVHANNWQWHRYIDQWCKNNGIESTIVNLGIGGTSVCTSSYVTAQLQPFVNRLDTIPTDADVVVIFGGTNDWGNNATLGTIDDTGTSTFYGAYKHILEWLAINRPNAKVMTMTPLKRYYRGGGTVWHNAQTQPNGKGNLLQDYVRAIKEVSNLYAVPCVDLHNDSGLNPILDTVRTKFMGDGLHPTAEGNKKMYPVILDKMRPLLEYD